MFAIACIIVGCASTYNPLDDYEEVQPAPAQTAPAAADAAYPAERLEHGQYMVDLLGCANCHTDGALIGTPDPKRVLAGSSIGIAWSNPLANRNPGVVFPSNLTPDPETGIGGWGIQQIIIMLQSGIDNHGSQSMPVMPWQAYAKLSADDAEAIAMYLKSLPPVKHDVPQNVRAGQKTRAQYVHFGTYQSRQ